MINKEEKFDVIVIGGGASGMMSACIAGSRGRKVLLLEKNKKLGEKLRISGGGRCNITNDEDDIRIFLANYAKSVKFGGKAPKKSNNDQFLYSAFSQFNKNNTFKFFESKNLPLVVEARKRAFPKTQKAQDVCKVLEEYLKENKVTVKTNSPVIKIVKKGNILEGIFAGGILYKADKFIFATGGLSHPETGSTGDGFRWLSLLGHNIYPPTPSIVPLAVKEKFVHNLAGITLSFMKITFFSRGVKSFSKTGKILFTHFGISGPLILNSASRVQDLLYEGDVTAFIDMYPDTNLGALDDMVVKVFDKNKNKILKNVLHEIVPEGMDEAFGILIADLLNIKVHSISRDNRKMIGALLKAVPITITGLMGYDRAVVADGGVPLDEINMKTMNSLKCKNAFITGDLLDINRPSGGFSLQICWTTGYVAGMNV